MAQLGNQTQRLAKRTWHFLIRVDVAVILLVVVLLFAVLGSFFPQQSPGIGSDFEAQMQWQQAIQARYGALASLLETTGVFRLYHSPLFVLAFFFLGLVTLICTLNRWRPLWRRALYREVQFSESAFEHASHKVELAFPPAVDILPEVQRRLKEHRFQVRSAEAAGIYTIRGDRNRLAHLGTLVTHIALLLLMIGIVLSGLFGWREEIVLKPGIPAAIPGKPDIKLVNDGFTIGRYPDGSAADYMLSIRLLDGAQEVNQAQVRVNQPLSYGGLDFYLWRFSRVGESFAVSVLAVRDPGFNLVVIAGGLLLLGMTVTFYFPHSRICIQVLPEGRVFLTGQAGRRAYYFEREFSNLVTELKLSAVKTAA